MNIFSTKSVIELAVIILACADVGRLFLAGSALLIGALTWTPQQPDDLKLSNDADSTDSLNFECRFMVIKLLFGVGGFILLELALSFKLIVKMYKDHVSGVKSCLWIELVFVFIYCLYFGGSIFLYFWKTQKFIGTNSDQLEFGLVASGIVFKIFIIISAWKWCRLTLLEGTNYVIVDQFDQNPPTVTATGPTTVIGRSDQILDPPPPSPPPSPPATVQIVQNQPASQVDTTEAESSATNLAANLSLILDGA